MIEPFCSEYVKSFRSHDREPDVERTKPCLYYEGLSENFLPAEDSKTIYNPERDESVIKELHLKNMVSTYHSSYCTAVGKKSLVIDPNDLEADQLMVYFNKYYKERTKPVLAPVETGRRVVGYSRFSSYYTAKTEYQETISREGYDYFRKDYDIGKSRLYGKKQEALKKLKEDKNADVGRSQQEEESNKKAKDEDKSVERAKSGEDNRSKSKTCMFCCEKYNDEIQPVQTSNELDTSEN